MENNKFRLRDLWKRFYLILYRPKSEWQVIAHEKPQIWKLVFVYSLLAGLIPAVIRSAYGLIYIQENPLFMFVHPLWPVKVAAVDLLSSLVCIYFGALLGNRLAIRYHSESNTGRSLQVVAYSFTPLWVAQLVSPVFTGYIVTSVIMLAISFYAAWLMFRGLGVVLRTPKEKVLILTILLTDIILIIFIACRQLLEIAWKWYFEGLL